MRAALAVALYAVPATGRTFAGQASAPAGYVESTVASGTGLILAPTAGQVLQIATDYLANYPQFLADVQALVDPAIVAAEKAQPEGALMQLVVRGLSDPPAVGSQAGSIANAVNGAQDSGTLLNTDGTAIQGWSAGAPVAYADDSTATLTLRWVKGQPWAWILIGVALATLGVVLYYMLRGSPYAMSSFVHSSQVVANVGSWLLRNWGYVAIGVGAVAVTPFAIRGFANIHEAENQERYAERGGF